MGTKTSLKPTLALGLFFFLSTNLFAQVDFKWGLVDVNSEESFRGLSVVSDDVIWISGSGGTVIKSIDGGTQWTKLDIPDADSLDFRDIQAFDDQTAYVISSGTPGTIYKTVDGGSTWKQQYFTDVPDIFFDGFDFADPNTGMAFGDPIGGKLYLVSTNDGKTWLPTEVQTLPSVAENEFAFAGSGTGIQIDSSRACIVTGGAMSRFYRSTDSGLNWEVFDTPIKTGEKAGIFSVHFWNETQGLIVGGDYEDYLNTQAVSAYTDDGGETWTLSSSQPSGYRSCVDRSKDLGLILAVGTGGTDLSSDDGRSWMLVDDQKFNTCQFGERTVWAVGPNGRVGKIVIY